MSEYYAVFTEDKLDAGSWNKTSKQAYDSIFTNHILPVFSATLIIKIERVQYQKFINSKLEINQLSRESVRSINNAFMSLLNHAVDTGVIERNRLRRIRIGNGPRKIKRNISPLKNFRSLWRKLKN